MCRGLSGGLWLSLVYLVYPRCKLQQRMRSRGIWCRSQPRRLRRRGKLAGHLRSQLLRAGYLFRASGGFGMCRQSWEFSRNFLHGSFRWNGQVLRDSHAVYDCQRSLWFRCLPRPLYPTPILQIILCVVLILSHVQPLRSSGKRRRNSQVWVFYHLYGYIMLCMQQYLVRLQLLCTIGRPSRHT